MTITIALLALLQFTFISLAALNNSYMDLIAQFDALKSWGYLYSKEAMEAPKEGIYKYFPKDFWHESKRIVVMCFGIAIGISFAIGLLSSVRIHDYHVLILISICDMVLSWIVFSASFEFFYSRGRRKYVK